MQEGPAPFIKVNPSAGNLSDLIQDEANNSKGSDKSNSKEDQKNSPNKSNS